MHPIAIRRMIRREREAHPTHRWGQIQAYDVTTHSATVLVSGETDPTGYLPLPAGFYGQVSRGMSAWVAYDGETPAVIVNIYPRPHEVPTVALAVHGSTYLDGTTTLGGPVVLTPAAITGTPTGGTHQTGELFLDSTGALYLCTGGGTPGIWRAVMLGSVYANAVGAGVGGGSA